MNNNNKSMCVGGEVDEMFLVVFCRFVMFQFYDFEFFFKKFSFVFVFDLLRGFELVVEFFWVYFIFRILGDQVGVFLMFSDFFRRTFIFIFS